MYRTFLLLALCGFSIATLTGGVGDLFPANSEIQELVNIIRPNIESRANRQFSSFKAIEFRSQVVSGLNYFVKIQVEEEEYAFARIYVHFSGNPIELSAFKLNKALHDKLDYFDVEEEPRRVGGTGDVTPATPEIQSIAESVRENFESNIGKKTEGFEAVHFVSQVVRGTNYFIKVKIGSNEFAFLRVYKPISGDLQLTAYQLGKSAEENVSYFEPHTHSTRVGGVGKANPASEEVQNIVNTVRGDFESKEGKQTHFQAIHYKSQVVAGANYFVKVQVSENGFAFLRIYKHFSGSITLHSYQVGKTAQDEVGYF